MINETLPLLTSAQANALEQLLLATNGRPLPQRMERAGEQLALLARHLLDDEVVDRPIVVLAGRGNNGGGGLVAARYLLTWGAWVQVVLTHPAESYRGVPAAQLQRLYALEAGIAWAEEGWELPPTDLVIDALVGGGLQGAPHGKVRDLIHLANSSMAPIVSLDLPSGLDTSSGELYTPHIRAAATMALGLPKVGLPLAAKQGALGDLYLADVGIPPQLYAQLGLVVPPLFADGPLVGLTVRGDEVWVS